MVTRMSMTFRITPRAAGHRVLPTAEAVLAGPEGVRVHNVPAGQQHEVMDAPLTGIVLVVGRPGASARGHELSHDGEAYTVRVFTPASRGDWRLALEHVARLARSVDATIVDENGVESTPETVGGFPFERDIRFGVEQIASVVQAQGEAIVPGLVRHVTFDRQMMDAVTGSDDPVARFESLMRTVQEVDAYEAKQLIAQEPDGEVVGVYQISQDQATILPLAKPRPTPENQEKLAGREVSSWWLIPVAIDGDPTQRESYQPLGRIPYYEFLRRLPQDKGFKLDATRMVVAPLDHAVVRILGQAAD